MSTPALSPSTGLHELLEHVSQEHLVLCHFDHPTNACPQINISQCQVCVCLSAGLCTWVWVPAEVRGVRSPVAGVRASCWMFRLDWTWTFYAKARCLSINKPAWNSVMLIFTVNLTGVRITMETTAGCVFEGASRAVQLRREDPP